MFYKNKPPYAHYQVHEGETPSIVRSALPGVTCETIQTITWGNAFSSTHGIRITKRTGYLIGSATGFYEVTIEWPWGTIAPITGVGVVTLVTDVLFDVLRLRVRSSCDWQLDFDSLDIELDINGAGLTSVASLGSTTDTGSGYDGRLNDVVTKTVTIISVAPAGVPEYPDCASDFASQGVDTLEGYTSSNWDWRYDRGPGWEYPDIDFDVLTPPDPTVPGGCVFDCSDPVPGVTIGEVWPRYTITSEGIADTTKEDLGLQICHCPPGTVEIQPGEFNVWTVTFLYHLQESTAGGLPKNAGILNSTKKAAARTWCVDPPPAFTETETTSLDPWTKADFYFYTIKIVNKGFCFNVVQLGLCAVGGDAPDSSISTPCIGSASACAYEAYVQLSHPDLPPCEADSFLLAMISRPDGRIYRLTADVDSTYFERASQVEYTAWTSNPIYDPAQDGDLARLPGGNVAVVLVISGTLYLGIVKDEGATALTMTSDGTATVARLVPRGDGTLYVYRVDGGTVKGSLRSSTDLSLIHGPWDTNLTGYSDTATIDVAPGQVAGNKPSIILTINDGTTETYLSTDTINFA